ncbi:MAG TPA: NAD-dependent epimerase/dehydratase family protein [Gemmatimonadaceae bacterium]
MTDDAPCDALIGHTGFVGSNLLRQHEFEATFNSSNIEQIAGRSFDLVVCCGAPAEKWKANADPERDLDNIERLTRALEHVNAVKLVLISTVDVFQIPVNVDEDSPTPTAGLQAYGKNRRRLEQIVASRFDATIVRLAGLYGPGLKKNVIHDFLHDHEVHKIDSRGVFQFYDVRRLWDDMATAMDARLPLVHLPAEPVSVADVARDAFDMDFTNEVSSTPARYDIHTKYAELFGGSGTYVENRTRELSGIAAFVASERQ